jgi:hypothetical protein
MPCQALLDPPATKILKEALREEVCECHMLACRKQTQTCACGPCFPSSFLSLFPTSPPYLLSPTHFINYNIGAPPSLHALHEVCDAGVVKDQLAVVKPVENLFHHHPCVGVMITELCQLLHDDRYRYWVVQLYN